tara:strand:+ start:287 stop:1432 length:1146 start_codon:yes stop_codon:yes gene_type:complete
MSKAAELAALIGSGQAQGDKNLLINSDMQVAQRGTSLAMAHDGTTNGYLIDRWRFTFGGSHSQLDGTYAQVADHPLTPNGKSLKWTTGTAESSYASSYYLYFVQLIEAQNLQGLQFGSSNAKTVTLSFYIKSSITGTYAVNLYKAAATTRIINKTYTISSANTWEKKTITFPADTASGADIPNSNGQGFFVSWHLAAGSGVKGNGSLNTWKNYTGLTDWADGQATNGVATTAGATWQMAQCQLEIGDVATAFEHEDFSTTLAKCQRYLYRRNFEIYDVVCQGAALGNKGSYCLHLPVAMRAKPSCSQGSGIYCWYNQSGSITTQTGLAVTYMGTNDTNMTQAFIRADDNSTAASATNYPLGLTSYDGSGSNSTFIQLDAEL